MYAREYEGQTYTLEASGGLIHSSLVMQDRETNSYWSLMRGEVIGGELKGLKIRELPVGEKIRWVDWRARHPGTVVLSINGKESVSPVYAHYFSSPEGFRGEVASDERLPSKEPIFAFRHAGSAYAIPHSAIQNGRSIPLNDSTRLLVYRPIGAEMFLSTRAYSLKGRFSKSKGKWRVVGSDCIFNPENGRFESAENQKCAIEALSGFDTFWYNWSLNNPDTEIVGVR